MKILVTGATGFIGSSLVNTLQAQGNQVSILTRNTDKAREKYEGFDIHHWDYESVPELGNPHCIIHLAGEPVFGRRWNESQKELLRSSRIDSTRRLTHAVAEASQKPQLFICASAIGFYGNRGDESLTEDSLAGKDFLAELCQEWEVEAQTAQHLGVRTVSIRIGIVLGRGGGALAKMLPPFRLGIGGPIGSGVQWMSWIHIDDLIGGLLFAIKNETIQGPVNGTAPFPVTNLEFSKTLGKVLKRPAFIPTPPSILKLALGEATSILTASQKVLPRVLQRCGFTFQFPSLERAIRASI